MPSDDCRVSIVVCTLNRAASLRQTLASIASQNLTAPTCEVIIVDNGGRDGTEDVVKEIRRYHPCAISYVVVTDKGLSAARNRGIKAASGEFLVFIDDDARACPEWLSTIIQSFDAHPGIDVIGGPVLPESPSIVPAWLPRRLRSHLSLVYYGNKPRMLRYPRFPIGTNMAIRKEVFSWAGYFDTALGRHGDSSQMTGEETDFLLRLERQGRHIYYAPRAVVYHSMHPDRLQPHWVLRQAYWIGRSTAVIETKSLPFANRGLNLAKAIALIMIDSVVWNTAALLNDRKLSFWARCILHNVSGYIHGILHLSGKKKGNHRTGSPSQACSQRRSHHLVR